MSINELRMLSADSGWNPSALVDAFIHWLLTTVIDQTISVGLPEDLDALIALIDPWIMERECFT